MSLHQKKSVFTVLTVAGMLLLIVSAYGELGLGPVLAGLGFSLGGLFLSFHWWRCPVCGGRLGRDMPGFCPDCGAKIDYDIRP